MLTGIAAKIAAGVAAFAILACLVLGWQLRESLKREGAAEVALKTEQDANRSNQHTIDRLEGDQVIAQAIAIADELERRKMEDDNDDLKKAVADSADGSCPGLAALIERRRVQRQTGGGGANP